MLVSFCVKVNCYLAKQYPLNIYCYCPAEWLFCSSVESSYIHEECLELSVSAAAVFCMCCWCQCVSDPACPCHNCLLLICLLMSNC